MKSPAHPTSAAARLFTPLLFLPLTAAGQSPVIDMNETGGVLATLDDWRAIIFVFVLLLFFQLAERWYASREARLERREMAELARNFSTSADKVADALSSVRTEMQVLRALTSRVESRND